MSNDHLIIVACPVCGSRDEYDRPDPSVHTCGHPSERKPDGDACAEASLAEAATSGNASTARSVLMACTCAHTVSP